MIVMAASKPIHFEYFIDFHFRSLQRFAKITGAGAAKKSNYPLLRFLAVLLTIWAPSAGAPPVRTNQY